MTKTSPIQIKIAFEQELRLLQISSLIPLRPVPARIKNSAKFAQIASTLRDVGVVEPPVVFPDRSGADRYLILEGHLRIEALKDEGNAEVACLIATDDEAFTYNKHVSRVATIQEYRMIAKAIERGVPRDKISRALNIDVETLRQKLRLVGDVCSEAANLLKDRHVPLNSFAALRKLVPFRQIEAAEAMISMNNYSVAFVNTMIAGTPQDQLTEPKKKKKFKGVSDLDMAMIERESANLDREFKLSEETHGADTLDLVIITGFLQKLLGNDPVLRYLTINYEDFLTEFRKLAEMEQAVA